MTRLFLLVALLVTAQSGSAAETWPEALARMPLRSGPTQLNRTNCTQILLPAFQSNATVKAILFMPGATDELYFFRRAQAAVTNQNPTVLDAVAALTNQTHILATFRAPFLLLHSGEDVLNLEIKTNHAPTLEKLQQNGPMPHWQFDDADWNALRKAIKGPLKAVIWPGPDSRESRHFYRHTFAAWNLTGWETLEAAAYTSKTRIIVRHGSVLLEPDERFGTLPKLEHFP